MATERPTRGQLFRVLVAEFIGTFGIVLFGCGSVCSSLSGAYQGIWQVAAVWGVGVALSIYATAEISGAHLNPAVTLAFLLVRPGAHGMTVRKALWYVVAQLLGGIFGGLVNLLVHGPTITAFERANGIIRGEPSSIYSASAFGEYFPNPGLTKHDWLPEDSTAGPYVQSDVSPVGAMAVEAWGTLVLAFIIFNLTHPKNTVLGVHGRPGVPVAIGATVSGLLALYAPVTQAGWNPARDLGPRIVAAAAGWGSVAIPGPQLGFWVYVVGPCVGAPLGAALAEFGLWGEWYGLCDRGRSDVRLSWAHWLIGTTAVKDTPDRLGASAAGEPPFSEDGPATFPKAIGEGALAGGRAKAPLAAAAPGPMEPIVFFTWDTPNGKKVAVCLEELAIPYRVVTVSLEHKEQYSPEFLRVNPNNKIPAIQDPNWKHPRTGEPLTLFESGAILLYLARQYGNGALLGGPHAADELSCLQWLFWQVSGLGPVPGQVHHFVAKAGMADHAPTMDALPPPPAEGEAYAYALERFDRETRRLYGVLDVRLAETRAFVAGEHFSVADIAIFCWVWRAWKHKVDLTAYPEVLNWAERVRERPAVRRGLLVPSEDLKKRPRIEQVPEMP